MEPEIYEDVTRSRLMTNTSSTQSKWRSPKSSRRSRREKEPISQDKINNETKHIKIPQTQYIDKVDDVSVAMQRQVFQIQTTFKESVHSKEAHERERCESLGRRRLSVSQHDDRSEQHDREGEFGTIVSPARLSFSPSLSPGTDAPLHHERVITMQKKPNLHIEF